MTKEEYEKGKIGLEQHDIGNELPTKEQLVKALKILADCCDNTHGGNTEIIIQHWNDGKEEDS